MKFYRIFYSSSVELYVEFFFILSTVADYPQRNNLILCDTKGQLTKDNSIFCRF